MNCSETPLGSKSLQPPYIPVSYAYSQEPKSGSCYRVSVMAYALILFLIIDVALVLSNPEATLAHFSHSAEGLMIITTGFWDSQHTQAGTSLEAGKTAAGFWEQADSTDRTDVRGQVCVSNTGDYSTERLAIADIVQINVGAGGFSDYVSSHIDVSGYPSLLPGETHCYPYVIEFLQVEGAKYRNLAHVSITNHAGWLPGSPHCPGPGACPFGPAVKANFKLPASPTIVKEDPSAGLDPTDCNRAAIILETSTADTSRVRPGSSIAKSWKIKNSGTCTWAAGYRAVFRGDSQLNAPDVLPIGDAPVLPQSELDLSVTLLAPEKPGIYQGRYRLLAADDQPVYLENGQDNFLWINLTVLEPEGDPEQTAGPSPTPTATLASSATPTTSQPTSSPSTSTQRPTPTLAPTLPAASSNCVKTLDFWLARPESWPAAELILGGESYSKEEALAILETQDEDDAAFLVAKQFIVTQLNLLDGADGSSIEAAVREAETWLGDHPPGSNPIGAEGERGLTIAGLLADYNNGWTGPVLCDGEVFPTSAPPEITVEPTTTPSPAPTETPLATITPTAAPTLAPSPAPLSPTPTATGSPETSPSEVTTPTPVAEGSGG